MTKKEYYVLMKDVISNTNTDYKKELLNFLDHEIEMNEKRAAKRAMTPKQIENEQIMNVITAGMQKQKEYGKMGLTVVEMIERIPGLSEYSTQKISALLTNLENKGMVERTYIKHKPYFSLAS